MSEKLLEKVSALVPSELKGESKSSKKKKGKTGTGASTPVPQTTTEGANGADVKANGLEGSGENAYVRELNKNIRNINKKLNATEKVSAIVAENPGVSIEELIANRKINADQKEQYARKPGLQAQLAQLEEQLAQYRKFDQEYQHKLEQEKELLQSTHAKELEKLRQTLKDEAAIEVQKTNKTRLLTLSRFLRAAAARRQREDDDSELSKAFEGALLLVYGGDASAVNAAEKLIEGADDQVTSTDQVLLNVTYAQVKAAALEEAPFAAEEAWVDSVAEASASAPDNATTDPTVAHAVLTELDTTTQIPKQEPNASADTPHAPPSALIDAGSGNQAAEEQWNSKVPEVDDPMSESYEIVPRNPSETETPAPSTGVQSWADDAANAAATSEPTSATTPNTNGNDGFREVVHHPRGGRGRPGGDRGGFRGRGRGGGFRGDRGDGYRGRGRGGGGFRGRGRGDSS